MKRILISASIIIIALSSCQKMKYGNVVERWHEPPRTYIQLMPMVICSGKTSTTVLIPYEMHDNEDWCIKVTGIGVKGDTITRTYYLTPESYDTMFVGKFVCIDGACNDDNNNTKSRKR